MKHLRGAYSLQNYAKTSVSQNFIRLCTSEPPLGRVKSQKYQKTLYR